MEIKFNEIKSRNELADFLNIKRKTLSYVLYNMHIENYYHSFEIPKKNGKSRKIDAPQDILKIIQKKLSNELYNYRDYICYKNEINLNISHAFERKKNIISNSFIHKNKRYVINYDLEDFFDSFHFGRVKGYFMKNKYFELSSEVSTVIAQLTCYKGKLPQGAPTSPIISNLICGIMDYKLLSLAKKYHLDYTRYADDLTFSTNDKKILDNYEEFNKSFTKIISNNGFKINSKKTRIIYKDSKQSVTGLIVNKKINVEHKYYKKVRSMAHNLYTNNEYYIDNEKGNINQLEGRFVFINQIDKYNNQYNNEDYNKFFRLNSREKEFQKFLFFKNFYINEKPIIVTEGKTDILYIKSSLKSLYEEYPNLIEKKANGEFNYKISFYKRNKLARFFFNMSIDGADAMKHLYSFFSNLDDKKIYPNYLEYFNQLTNGKPKNPVILIFDNEIKSGKRPLKSFLNFCNFKDKTFNNGGYEKLSKEGNIYLATHQLVKGKDECEIEDLFEDSVLNHKINGKSFSRKKEYNIEKFYGKDYFSKYIFSNYKDINFSNFRNLLNQINEIIVNNY